MTSLKEQAILAGDYIVLYSPDYIVLESDLALIAVVGHWYEGQPWYFNPRVFKALAKENINVKMIDQGYQN